MRIGDYFEVVRLLGFKIITREVIRRLFRIPYRYNGFMVSTDLDFRALVNIKSLGYELSCIGEWRCSVKTAFGTLYVPYMPLLISGFENYGNMYSPLNVRGKVVLDVGALIGETALYFISRGARLVYAYEPVPLFYNYLVRNVKLNGVEGIVKTINAGLWFKDGEFCININEPGPGLWIEHKECDKSGFYRVKVLEIAREFNRIYNEVGGFVVKLDCEGCEYSLLTLPCNVIKYADEYVMEVHGAPSPIVDKLNECGFEMSVVSRGTYSIIHFRNKALK